MSRCRCLRCHGLNEDWRRRSLAAVCHPCTQMKLHAPEGAAQPLVPIARAEGVWLHDFEGPRLLDAISSWWVNFFGHNHPAILRTRMNARFSGSMPMA